MLPQLIPSPLTVPSPLLETVSVLFVAACAAQETNSVIKINKPKAHRLNRGGLERCEVGAGIFNRTPRGAADISR